MEAIEWSDGSVVIVDGRQLPGRSLRLICRDYPELSEAIRSGAISDSSALGVAAAMGIALGAQRSLAKTVEEFDEEFETICVAMTTACPDDQNIASVVRQFRSTCDKYRPGGILVVRIALLVEALTLWAETYATERDDSIIPDRNSQSACAIGDLSPATSPRYHFS